MDVIEFILTDLAILQISTEHFSVLPIKDLMSVVISGEVFRRNVEITPGEAHPAEGNIYAVSGAVDREAVFGIDVSHSSKFIECKAIRRGENSMVVESAIQAIALGHIVSIAIVAQVSKLINSVVRCQNVVWKETADISKYHVHITVAPKVVAFN
jgi:hypothetical protein